MAVQTPNRIDAATLAEWRDRDPELRLLDVRTPAEFETAHIPGAYNVPLDLIDEHRAEIAHLDHPMVLVCRSGQRADQGCQKLASAGMANLYVLDGGIGSWEAMGGPVSTGRARWALERQVRLVAGSIVLGSILTSVVAPKAKWVAGAIGAGLTFAALSDTCMMGTLLGKLPYNRSSDVDVDTVVQHLAAGAAAPVPGSVHPAA